jgi:hypothetical protein
MFYCAPSVKFPMLLSPSLYPFDLHYIAYRSNRQQISFVNETYLFNTALNGSLDRSCFKPRSILYSTSSNIYVRILTFFTVQFVWKADIHSACQRITCFLYGTQRFITVLIKARHWTLSWASRIQFAPSIPISLRYVLMFSSPPTPRSSQWSLTFGPTNQKPCKHLSPPPCVPHVPPTLSSLI